MVGTQLNPGVAVAELTWPDELVTLYRERYDRSVRTAYLLVGSQEVAEELVQDAFLAMRRSWSKVEKPAAYLRTAVTNACHSHHRRRVLELNRRTQPSPTTVRTLG